MAVYAKRELHWLSVQDRIYHKLLSVTFLSVHGDAPFYLSELLHLYIPSRPLRSDSRSVLEVRRPRDYRTKRYGQRAFRHVALYSWNALPEGIRESESVKYFKASLKTHFFFKTHFFNSHYNLLSHDINTGSRCDDCVDGVCACVNACVHTCEGVCKYWC